MKLLKELHAQVWTICGVALVLITLSGVTLRRAFMAFAISMCLHFAGTMLPDRDED